MIPNFIHLQWFLDIQVVIFKLRITHTDSASHVLNMSHNFDYEIFQTHDQSQIVKEVINVIQYKDLIDFKTDSRSSLEAV